LHCKPPQHGADPLYIVPLLMQNFPSCVHVIPRVGFPLLNIAKGSFESKFGAVERLNFLLEITLELLTVKTKYRKKVNQIS
jgi:hypothetical protein